MDKLEVLGASVATILLLASPAPPDTVRVGGFTAEDRFLFFENGVFGDNGCDGGFFD